MPPIDTDWGNAKLVITPDRFSTLTVPPRHQLEAWRGWYDSVFDVSVADAAAGFPAECTYWSLDALSLSRVSAPALTAVRTKALIRRTPIDHWVITLGQRDTTGEARGGENLSVPAGAPFVVSLGHELVSSRAADTRLQLYLPRDFFPTLAPLLDSLQGKALDTPLGRLLADYLRLLDRSLPELSPSDLPNLTQAVRAMVLACVGSSADAVVQAAAQIDIGRRERLRQIVNRNLDNPALGPEMLCREMAMSRTQLYRLLDAEGGIARHIQRKRLLAAYAALCNPADTRPIGVIAEALCFPDASSFSRAFRHQFGMSPRDVRSEPPGGLHPILPVRIGRAEAVASLKDCLRQS